MQLSYSFLRVNLIHLHVPEAMLEKVKNKIKEMKWNQMKWNETKRNDTTRHDTGNEGWMRKVDILFG